VAFRDDREALLQRVGVLERELASERVEHAESENARQRLVLELAAARQELERLRPYAPGEVVPRSRRMLALGVGLAIAVAAATIVWGSFTPPEPGSVDLGPHAAPREAPRGSALAPVLPAGATGCRSSCDCSGGAECSSGQCLLGTEPAYCCGDPRCPAGATCQRPDGVSARCGATDSTTETRAAIQAAQSAVRECVANAASPHGRLLAKIRFGVDGGVTGLRLEVTQGDLQRVLPCIDDTLRAMTIPPPGHVLDVEASFVFDASP
jgi:hypothetical protein